MESMATTKRAKKGEEEENLGGSVRQSPGMTTGRQEKERRIGSGNARAGSVENQKRAERSPRPR